MCAVIEFVCIRLPTNVYVSSSVPSNNDSFDYNQYASIDPSYTTDDMLDGGFEQQAPDLRFRQLQGKNLVGI